MRSTRPEPRAQEKVGGARRDRTDDLLLAKQALSQLSYGPGRKRSIGCYRLIMVGLGRLELPTSRLSGVRSNHLSYRPDAKHTFPIGNVSSCLKKEKRRRRHPACWGLTGPDCSNDEPIGPDDPENPEGSSLERR